MIRLTETIIRNIIREEINSYLNERGNPFHNPETGRFGKGISGAVYSISKPKEKETGLEAKKGIVSGKGTTSAKYGMSNDCGRISVSGKSINPVYSCSKYKKKYSEIDEGLVIGETDIENVSVSNDERYENVMCIPLNSILSIIDDYKNRMNEEASNPDEQRCRALGFARFDDLLNSINSVVRASSGDLYNHKSK